MKSRMACAAVLTALAWAPMSWAVGLGEVDLRSALNQPLDARIELVSPTEQELEALRIALASPDHFERYGLERTALHTRLNFEVVEDDGTPFIHVTTREPVREPYVSFLVEARWASGRLLREYTLLLDPPSFGPGEADQGREPERAVTERAREERERPRREAERTEPAEEDRQAARESEPRPEEPDRRRRQVEDAPGPGDRYGPVRRNETLWNIADRMRPSGVSINQMMIALFEANPGAFGDNINNLRQGTVLRVPERGEIDSVSVARANSEVSRQNESWQGGRTRTAETPEREQQDELRLVAPGDEEADSVGVGTDDSDERVAELESELEQLQSAQQETAEENESLEARVNELREELEEQRRLVELKDEQLASLQQRVSDEDLEAGLEEDAVFADESEDEASADTEETTEDEEVVAAGDDGTDGADADEETRVAEADEEGEEPGQDEADGDEESAAADTEATDTEEEAEPAGNRGQVADSPSIFDRVTRLLSSPVGLGVLGALVLAMVLGLVAMRRRKSAAEAGGDDLEASLESEAADAAEAEDAGAYEDVNLADDAGEDWEGSSDSGGEPDLGQSVDEVIEEADFHIAYGTYDKAASQLEEALASNSRDPRLYHKLLEAHFAAGNADEFVSAARRMRDAVGEDAEEWSSAARMGREIAPNEGLFAAAASAAAGGAAADEGSDESDLTLPESPAIESEQPAAGDDEPFDLDLDTGTDESAGGSEDTGEEISFDLPDESGSEESGGDEDDSLSFDLPDMDEDSGDSEPSEAGAAEETSDDSFDWDDSDDTIDFGLDDESASALDRTAEEDSGEDSDDSDFPTVDVPPEKANEAFGTDSQAQFEKAFQELSSYIGSDVDEESERSEDKAEGGDRPGRTTDDDASPGGIDFGEDDDDDLLDLGDDEADEAGEIDTKVDLARAYIDMGDADGARGILEEVIEEGNDEQKKEAQSLLDSI